MLQNSWSGTIGGEAREFGFGVFNGLGQGLGFMGDGRDRGDFSRGVGAACR